MSASDRLDEFLEELDRANLADLEVLSLPESDPGVREALLERVAAAARDAGGRRAKDIQVAREQIREMMFARFAQGGLTTTWAGVSWQASPMRVDDRLRLVAAIEDAAVAAMMADRLDPADVEALTDRYRISNSMAGAGVTGVPDLTGERGLAAVPLGTAVLLTGAGGLGLVGAIAGLLGRRRRRLEASDPAEVASDDEA